MWIYRISTGELWRNGALKAKGYSGDPEHRNNPLSTHLVNRGPIPAGCYYIGAVSADKTHGPNSIHLIPLNGTETFGRGGFLVHGDSIKEPGTASHGCIIMPPDIRKEMIDGVDKQLVVMPEPFFHLKEIV